MKNIRYSRQTQLEEIKESGQSNLQRSKVLLVGMGGLNSPTALYLSAAGVGTIGIIDDDDVCRSNLHRQIIFNEADEGQKKVFAALEKLLKLNSETTIHCYDTRLTNKNVEQIFSLYDLIIDGSDNFSTKFLINDAAHIMEKPIVYGAVNQFEGQVALFDSHNGPCYRCLHPNMPSAKIQNCAEAGVLGSVVGVIGSMQATIALEYLISKNTTNHPLKPECGILSVMSFRDKWSFTRLKISKKPDCKTCSKQKNEIILDSNNFVCSTQTEISSKTLNALLQNPNHNFFILDVREKDEWETGHIENAVHWPLSTLKNKVFPTLPDQNQIVVYCQSGARSLEAINLMASLNIPMLNLKNGLHSWRFSLVNN